MFHTPEQHKEEAGGLFLKAGPYVDARVSDVKMNFSASATGGLKYLSLLVKHLILVAIISCELKALCNWVSLLSISMKLFLNNQIVK